MGECYVCTEMAYTLSPCKCKNLFLHDDCYAKLLAYDNKQCGVCLEDFPLPDLEAQDVYVEKKIRTNYCLPILFRTVKTPVNKWDLMVDPLRHLVAEFIFFNVFKFVIKTSSYQMFLFDGEDIYILVLSLIVYSMFALAVRGMNVYNDRH
tara:strand:- start:3976 stop:4425 length:450 start_codon:yes stop_codon:yes gene_type:complete